MHSDSPSHRLKQDSKSDSHRSSQSSEWDTDSNEKRYRNMLFKNFNVSTYWPPQQMGYFHGLSTKNV